MAFVRKSFVSSARRPYERSSQEDWGPVEDLTLDPVRNRSNPLGSLLGHAGRFFLGTLLFGSTAVASGLVGLALSFRNLPDVHLLKDYTPVETTHIVDVRGEPIASLHGEANREVIRLNEVSANLKKAVLAIEDSHFYQHRGINPVGIGRAVIGSIEGGFGAAGGGSTLTQQLVKNLFLTPDPTITRKAAEAVLAVRLEQVFTKDQIFEMYLNQVYWGHNLYGVQTASESYFNKSASDLTLAEAAMLAGLLQAPERLSPFRDYRAAKQRQKVVLDRMAELGWIKPQEAKAAYQERIRLGRVTSFSRRAPAITDAIEADIRARYGQDALTRGGLRIQAAIDMRLQRLAEQTVAAGIANLAANRRNAGQMALVAIDPRTGFIKAMVGGANARRGQFNRATQARRQSGSTFKPFVYYTALATGRYSPFSTLLDMPVTYPGYPRSYSPQNYDETFAGPMTMTRALELSRNVPTVRLANDIGIRNVIRTAERVGIKSPLYPNLSTSLGSGSVTPTEMTAGFAAFANGGFTVEPLILMQVVNRNGQIVFQADPRPKRTLDPWSVAWINQMLEGVVTSGTGTRARLADGRPVAGKTGTTSDFRDAWFIGYVPQLATSIWIGNDNNTPMAYGTAGGGFVAPIWSQFMSAALKDVPPQTFASPNRFAPPRP